MSVDDFELTDICMHLQVTLNRLIHRTIGLTSYIGPLTPTLVRWTPLPDLTWLVKTCQKRRLSQHTVWSWKQQYYVQLSATQDSIESTTNSHKAWTHDVRSGRGPHPVTWQPVTWPATHQWKEANRSYTAWSQLAGLQSQIKQVRRHYISGTGRRCTGAGQTLRVHSPGGRTVLREMTSWPPSWKCDVKSKLRLRHWCIIIYSTSILLLYHFILCCHCLFVCLFVCLPACLSFLPSGE